MAELVTNESTCPNCERTVTEVNLWKDLGTCLFCDLNRNGPGGDRE